MAEDRNGILIQYYYNQTGLIGMNYNGENYMYVKDALGNITELISASGVIAAQYSYDAWGNTVQKSGSLADINPFRYRGYYMDIETGWYYLQTRYYDPAVRRFINADNYELIPQLASNIGELNLFSYCNNNPISYTDPTGQFVLSTFLIGAGIAAFIGAGVGAVAYTAGQLISYGITGEWNWSWGQFGGSVLGGAVGGAFCMIPGVGTMLGAFVTGFASSAIGMGMQNALGETNYSGWQIFGTSLAIGGVSALTAGIMDNIKISGLNAGRNSMSAITKSTTTKFWRGSISRISMKTVGKIATVQLYNGALGTAVNGVFSAFGVDRSIAYQIYLLEHGLRGYTQWG